ncbi:BREX-1 system phosphatase PglZ type B [Paraburkholderia heleia]|uniref:BREX-1 system phosphatase PglZ type B n=1 Tax=Paraburkholderia heleia TaxID=634127 RepID=UPI002AB7AB9A|nr:BREX-1 system phosphatase PglZ type B [Paraburkholderia heleia]
MTSSQWRNAPLRAKGLLDALELSFIEALRTPEGTAQPVALLWTDTDGQWSGLTARLQTVLPNLFILGPYMASERTGPAVWLRCVVDRALPDVHVPDDAVPILYLPGVARQVLRAGEECPQEFRPLVELLYRGRVWHQRNGRDWTVDAFLSSEDGLGLDVSQDARTREAALRSLALLAEIPLDGLRGHRLDSDDFDRLAVSDPTRDLLRWMGLGDAFRTAEGDARWKAFCSVCASEFRLDPDKKSPGDAARELIAGTGKWASVWQRFKEAPKLYPGVAQLLRESPGQLSLGFDPERSPCDNDQAEQRLRKELEGVAQLSHASALAKVLALENEHGRRREWVWAQLGESPLAIALEPLARVAAAAATTLGGVTIDAAISGYVADGWRCDRAALDAMSSVRAPADAMLVGNALRALYLPWLDASARHFQSLVQAAETGARAMVTGAEYEKDTCLFFADGLRFDVAQMLRERLEAKGLRTRLGHRMAPLPTVTATAKPFSTIAHCVLEGGEDAVDFNPCMRGSGQAATAQRLRDDMARRGLDILGDEIRPAKQGTTGGWVETGRLDELGHKLGSRLAAHLETELETLVDQITGLLECGWTRIRIVTDHGWLLVPGALPRIELPSHLVATKWSRCANVKGDSKPNVPIYSWYWNVHVHIASPPGAGSFAPNTEYSHGGVSPQECVVPELIVERGGQSTVAKITSAAWRGMRCRVSITTNDPSVRVDLRLNWKQATTSIAASVKEVGPAGEASIAVADDSHEGAAATLVVLDPAGVVLDRMPTTVGEAT